MVTKMQRLKSVQAHLALLGLSIAAIITALCVLWFDVANQPALPASFSYSADAVATKTSYGPNADQPITKQYLTAKIQLTLTDRTVENNAVSTTATGDIVSVIASNRPVDPTTGLYNGQPSDTYVMAPRNLKKGQDFQTRFPTYDVPTAMKFQGEDTVLGLKTYTYAAEFSEPIQGTWQEEKVSFTPELRLWIEPTTGWLVKYQDDSTLRVAGADGAYSHISQKASSESVRQHVSYAKTQKTRMVFAQQVAPGVILSIILALGLAFSITRMKKRVIPLYASLGIITISSLIVIAGWVLESPLLATLFLGASAMNPLDAICFILVACAIALLYKGQRPIVAFTGGLIMIFATLQILGNLGALPFSVDLLFFRDAVTALDQTLPSRMSTFDAFTFLVISIAFIKAGFTTKHTEIHFAKFIAGVAFSLGVFGLILQVTQIDEAFSLTFIQSVPLVAPVLFILGSYSLMQLFRSIHDKPDDVRSTLATLRWPSIATVPLVIIGMFAQIQQNNVRQSLNASFKEQTTAFETNLENQMDIYSNTLTGARALFSASLDVTAGEFRRFVSNYQSDNHLSGLIDIGFASYLVSQKTFVNPYTNQTAAAFPETEDPTKTPIVYSETLDKKSSLVVGYDLSSDSQLRQTFEQARDSGKAILSANSPLPSTDNNRTKTTNLLVLPIYHPDSDNSTVTARRSALTGYVFGTISIDRLVESLATDLQSIDYDIYDGLETESDSLLYSTGSSNLIPRAADVDTRFIANHPLTIVYSTTPSFRLSPQEEFSPTLVLLGGSLTYFAVLTILYFLADLEHRTRLKERLKKRGAS